MAKEEIIIFHNPKCSKSREALQLLEQDNQCIVVREYLKETPNKKEIKSLLQILGINAEALMRKGEDEYKNLVKGKNLDEDQLVTILSENPKLIERPIVIKGNKAVIGRPPALVLDLVNK